LILSATIINPILPESKKKLDCGFYLANERIYLKWARTVVFMAIAGFTFLQKGFAALGYISLIFCLFICGYSGVTFWLRKNAFLIKQPFYDPIGLSVIIVLVFLFLACYGFLQATNTSINIDDQLEGDNF